MITIKRSPKSDRITSGSNSAVMYPTGLTVNTGITATSFIKSGGLLTEYLMADGSSYTGDTYTNLTPTQTVNGGIPTGATFDHKSITWMFDSLLYPELFPTLVAPSSTFTSNIVTTYEVGVTMASTTFSAVFNRGSITPAYGTNGFRSGLPTQYTYGGSGMSNTVTSGLTDSKIITGYTIAAGVQSWTGNVTYSAGEQPLSNKGNNYSTALPSGTTSTITISTTGIYPYFYGKVSSGGAGAGVNRPTATLALVTGGTKVVASSTGTILITFNATSDDYLWFAIPTGSTSKTVWYVSATNYGTIGAGNNLFPLYDAVTVSTINWNGIVYKVYISNYQSGTSGIMEMRNS